MIHNFDALPTDVYIRTSELNGRIINRGKQVLRVIDGALIKHGKLFPNKDIRALVLLEGRRGARYEGYLYQNGNISLNH